MNKYKIYIFFGILICLLLSLICGKSTSVFNNGENKKYLAIVIDDFGNGSEGTEEMLALPIKLTGAVMPKMGKSQEEYQRLLESGKAAILHQPMEAHTGKLSWLGPAPILGAMSDEQAGKVFEENIKSLPNLKGFNNHMGSLITEDEEKMAEIMRIAKENDLYFIDSVTTANSAAEAAAKKAGVPYYKRDVFLDSTDSKETVKQNLRKAADIAKERGFALAIGHVGAEGGKITAEAIKEMLPELEGEGIEFVTIEDMEKLKAKQS